MEATIVLNNVKHYPVLLKEIISVITPQHGGTFIDCTLGQGGYTKEILKYENTKVIGLDRDTNSEVIGKKILEKYPDRFLFKNLRFSKLNNLKLKNENIKGAIFDLGYSYSQIKSKEKKLSFDSTGKLNMRMGLNEFSANEVINKLSEKKLDKIFKFFGEEKNSKRIARNIIKYRNKKEINTEDLVKIIDYSKNKKKYKIHNATKVFQALRIFVNKEISELIYGLINATKVVKKNGIILVVSFHSLEDKIVKHFFKSLSEVKSISRYLPKKNESKNLLQVLNKKAIIPSSQEIEKNPPSRSAKLRYAIKKEDFYDFDTDIMDKFKYLLDVEKYSEDL